MTDIAVSAEGISKLYRIGRPEEPYGRLTETLSRSIRSVVRRRSAAADTERDFWALTDVSFTVRPGEVLGIIGRNGAGKSTLLKILSRITEPTKGSIRIVGRVGSLLEVGTGFHPELTGRENVFLSGAILGMRRTEIARHFDEIVAFADIGQFLDTPVKRYSSGMKVRLGFAVAAFLEPEILVIDEVLAVGDAEFQRKCLARMDGVAHEGRTVLFVSHNMAAVESLCSSALLLERGRITDTGVPSAVVGRYLARVHTSEATPISDRLDRDGTGQIRMTHVEASVRTGSESQIRIGYRAEPGLGHLEVTVGVYSLSGESAGWLSNEMSGDDLGRLPTEGTIVCDLSRMALLPGRYTINVQCLVGGTVADYVVDAASIDVGEGDFFGTGKLPPQSHGFVALAQAWSVVPETPTLPDEPPHPVATVSAMQP